MGSACAIDGIARAAIAHLWFETIHPFEDGNGRVGRAIVDMALAQDLGAPTRLYSLSQQLLADRRGYYDALAAAQVGAMDVTAFVQWFADAFGHACTRSGEVIEATLEKSRFWATHARQALNERQRQLLQRLLDAGDAQRGLLHTAGQGKALRYYLSVPGWTHGREAGG